MAVRFQRHLGRVETLDLSQYTVETVTGTPALRCPRCGGIDDLPLTHAIDDDGRVTPAWKCGNPDCSFKDWIELQSFAEEVV